MERRSRLLSKKIRKKNKQILKTTEDRPSNKKLNLFKNERISNTQFKNPASLTPDMKPNKLEKILYKVPSNKSMDSYSSNELQSPRLNQILSRYSKDKEPKKIRTVFSKNKLISAETQSPEGKTSHSKPHPKHFSLSPTKENAKLSSRNLLLESKIIDMNKIQQQIHRYENIIKNSPNHFHLKRPLKTNSSKNSISKSRFETFWNLRESVPSEPSHLKDLEGFKNLWVIKVESNLISPFSYQNLAKKFPSSVLYKNKYFK